MLKRIADWWWPHRYHVEYFRFVSDRIGDHDNHEFCVLADAQHRLEQLLQMREQDIHRELGYAPAIMRIMLIEGPNPIRRLLNACGSRRVYQFGPFRI